MPRSDKKIQRRSAFGPLPANALKVTDAEMVANLRRAGLPDNWMNTPIKFGNGNHGENFVKAFTAHINQASK